MNTKKNNELLKNYLNGETSLEEEEKLFSKIDEEEPLSKWAEYRKYNQIKVPETLSEQLFDKIDQSDPSERKLFKTLIAMAAVITLLALFYINPFSNKAEMHDKNMTLEEAMGMFQTEEKLGSEQVLYEDELVIIYLENN